MWCGHVGREARLFSGSWQHTWAVLSPSARLRPQRIQEAWPCSGPIRPGMETQRESVMASDMRVQ